MELQKILILFLTAIRCIQTAFLIPNGVSTNIGTGFDTTMTAGSFYPSYYAGATGSTYIFQLDTQTTTASNPAVYLFAPGTQATPSQSQGVLTAGAIGTVASTVMMESKELFACGTLSSRSDNLQKFVVAWDAATSKYSQVGLATLLSAVRYASKLVSDSPRSNYIFYLVAWSQPNRVRRWDYTTPSPGAENVNPGTAASLSMQTSQDWLVVYGSAASTIIFVNRQSLSLDRSVTGSQRAITFMIDNQNPNIYYATNQQNPFGVARLALGTSTYTITHTVPGQGAREQSTFINLMSIGYIGMIKRLELNYPLRLYYKSDLLMVQPPTFTAFYLPTFVANSLTSGPSFENDFTFAIQVENPTNVYNFHKWVLKNEFCLSRIASVCRFCTPGYYVNMDGIVDNTCYQNGWGKSLISGSLVACSDPSCLACGADHTKCTRCDPMSAKPYLFESGCLDLPGIPNRFGVNLADNTVVGCGDSNCRSCRADHKKCTECDATSGLRLVDGGCMLQTSSAVRVQSVSFDADLSRAEVILSHKCFVNGSVAAINVTVADLVQKVSYSCQDLGCTVTAQENGLSIVFNTTKVILKGEITIHRTPGVEITRTEDGITFTAYPIKIPGLVVFSFANSPVHRSFRILTRIAEILKFPGQLSVAFLAPSLIPVLDAISMKSSIYALFHGNMMFYADLSTVLLLQHRNWLVPVSWNNTAPEISLDAADSSASMYQRLGISPIFLENLEPDLWQMCYYLCACVCIKLVLWGLRAWKNRPAKVLPWMAMLTFMDSRWGLVVFAAKIDGNMLGYLTYAFLDLKHSSEKGISGTVFNRIYACLFLVYSLVGLSMSIWILISLKRFYGLKFWDLSQQWQKIPEHSEQNNSEHEKNFRTPEQIKKNPNQVLDLDAVPELSRWFVKPWLYLYAGDEVPKSAWYLLLPQLMYAKQLAVVCFLIFDSSPTAQCLEGLVLELLALLFVCCFSNRSSIMVSSSEKLLQLCWALMLLGKYMSHYYVADMLQIEMSNWLFATQLGLQAILVAISGIAILITLYRFVGCQAALLADMKDLQPSDRLPLPSEEARLQEMTNRNKQAANTLQELAKLPVPEAKSPYSDKIPSVFSASSSIAGLRTLPQSENLNLQSPEPQKQ